MKSSCQKLAASTACLFYLSVPTALYAEGQSIRVQRISVTDGLYNKQVQAIAQDGDGYIWISTADGGLQRYDGYGFKDYQLEVGNPDWTFLHPDVGVLYADRSGTLWLGTESGLKRYDPGTGSFISYIPDPNKPDSLSGFWVTSIYEDRAGTLWVGTMRNGLNRFDRESETFERYRLDSSNANSSNNDRVTVVFEDRDGALWFGTEGVGVSKLDPITKSLVHYATKDSVGGIFEDHTGTLWFIGHRRTKRTGSGLSRLDRDSNSFVRYRHDPDDPNSIGVNQVFSIVEDRFGILWLATSKGLDSYDRETDTFTHFRHDERDQYSLSHNRLSYMYEDRAGVIWLGGMAGLNRFDPRSKQFAFYSYLPEDRNSLSENVGAAAYVDDLGILWVAGDPGLTKLDRQQNKVTRYPLLLDADGRGVASVLDITKEPGGAVWIGTIYAGLQRFDPSTETMTQYLFDPDDPTGLGPGWVFDVHIDTHGTLWVGMDSGLYEFVADSQTFVRHLHEPSNPFSAGRQNAIGEIYEDRSGTLWLGTGGGGFNRFDPVTKSGTNFSLIRGKRQGHMDDMVFSFHEDRDGYLWLGTGTGLMRFDYESKELVDFQIIDGVTNAPIRGLQGDSSGFLWFYSSTIGRLIRLDPVSWDYVPFETTDGLPSDLGVFAIQSQGGEMFFGSFGGLVAFFPERIELDSETAPVVLTEFMLFNLPVPLQSPDVDSPLINAIGHSKEIVLSPEQYMFSFEFAALHYRGADRGKFAYQLVGHDPDWIVTRPYGRIATYSGVPPGDYQFRVKATNGQGKWSEKGATVNVVILAPFWRTWWAYTIYALAATLMVALLIRVRTLSLTRRAELLEDRVRARTRQIKENEQLIQHQADRVEELLRLKEKLFTNISHEFRTPLTLILGPIERMLRQAKDTNSATHLRMVKKNGQRLLRLVDQLLGLSRLSAEEPVTQSAQPLLPMVKTIVDSFQPLAEEKRIQLGVVDGKSLWVNCAPDALEKILLNLVSNAIKYTPDGGWVNVRVASADADLVRLSVIDSGIGIDPKDHQSVFERFYRVNGGESAPGAGLGLALVKELTESYGGSIELESSPGQGTTVDVLLPRHTVEPIEEMSLSSRVETGSIPLEVVASIPPVSSLSSQRLARSNGRGNGQGNGQGNGEGNGRESLLIVEDNLDMQEYLVSLLSESYHCQVATDGEEGVSFALESIPDLVLCDVMLPKMDGFKVSETLKTNELTSHIPIVMLTGRGDSDSRLKGLREAVDDYLTKPFNDEELSLRIANLLAARDAMKRKFSRQLFDRSEAGSEMGAKDLQFLNKLRSVLERHYGDPDFRVDRMSVEMAMSDRQLQRKLKAIVDHSPAEYLRSFRLSMAVKQLKQGRQVGLVAEAVGFSSQAYFASCFKAEFGATPSEYQQRLN